MRSTHRWNWLSTLALLGACADAAPSEPSAASGQSALYAVSAGASAAVKGIAAYGGGTGAAGAAGAAGNSGPGAGSAGSASPATCPDGLPRGAAAKSSTRRIASVTPSPEGVTVCPDGEVYIALDQSGEVWHVPLDGGPKELWATLSDRRPAGLACDEQGRLFVTTFAAKSGKANASLAPVLIAAKGGAPVELPQPKAAPPYAGLNGIAAVPGIGVYVSDTNNNNLVLLQEQAGVWQARVVASDIALANGVAYSKAQRALYVNASGSWELLQFKVGEDGALSDRKSLDVPFMLFMDGVTVDERGELYVADWLGGAVVAVSTGRAVMNVANPASLAFRGGTLLATDYKLSDPNTPGGLYAVDLGVCGGAN